MVPIEEVFRSRGSPVKALRQAKLNDLANDLCNRARKAWKKPASFALTLARFPVSALTAPLAAAITLAGSLIGYEERSQIDTGAYSYLFRAHSRFDGY